MKAIVTVLGKDKPGIIATVSGALYKMNSNILDITQTVMRDEYFVMIMMVDLGDINVGFDVFKSELETCAKGIGMDLKVQREEIFQSMHRI